MATAKVTSIRLLRPVRLHPEQERLPIGTVLSESEQLPKKEMQRLVKAGFAEWTKTPAGETK